MEKILQDYRLMIIEDLEPNNILPDLDIILTENEEEEIKAQSTRWERCVTLLQMLPRKGSIAFKVFVEALKEEAPHLALELIQAGNNRLSGIEVSIK